MGTIEDARNIFISRNPKKTIFYLQYIAYAFSSPEQLPTWYALHFIPQTRNISWASSAQASRRLASDCDRRSYSSFDSTGGGVSSGKAGIQLNETVSVAVNSQAEVAELAKAL